MAIIYNEHRDTLYKTGKMLKAMDSLKKVQEILCNFSKKLEFTVVLTG